VTPAGGVAIAGRRTTNRDRMFVLRLRPDGSRQPTFGDHGLELVDFGKPQESVNTIAFTPQGRIVLGGFVANGVTARSALARLSATGRLDPGFGGDGMVTLDVTSGVEEINDLRVLPGGTIVAAGDAQGTLQARFSVLAVTGDGRLDRSFAGGDGVATINVSKGNDVANAITRAANGGFLLAGLGSRHSDWAVAAITPDGNIDRTYGNHGHVVISLAKSFEEATDVVTDGSRTLLVGRIHGTGDDIGVIRLRAGGGLDHTFDGDGIARYDVFGSTDAGTAALLQPNGRLVVGGQSWRDGVPRFSVLRVLT
jgi:uncharacterized delta-60 repeat protein